MADRHRRKRPAEAAKRAGDYDLGVDDAGDRDAEKFDADFIVADRRRQRPRDRAEIQADERRGGEGTSLNAAIAAVETAVADLRCIPALHARACGAFSGARICEFYCAAAFHGATDRRRQARRRRRAGSCCRAVMRRVWCVWFMQFLRRMRCVRFMQFMRRMRRMRFVWFMQFLQLMRLMRCVQFMRRVQRVRRSRGGVWLCLAGLAVRCSLRV